LETLIQLQARARIRAMINPAAWIGRDRGLSDRFFPS